MISLPVGKVLVFDRTPVARLVSCAAAFGSAALVFDYLARGWKEVEILPFVGLILLAVAAIVSALVQYGDHIYLSADGVLYRNRFLPFLNRQARWLSWDDIVEVREIREKILILLSADGRRVLVDAIFGYAIARSEILARASHAVFTGTLAREDHV